MKSKWMVSRNYIGNAMMYRVFRLRDENQPDNSGNREYRGEYTMDKAAALKLAQALNDKEAK